MDTGGSWAPGFQPKFSINKPENNHVRPRKETRCMKENADTSGLLQFRPIPRETSAGKRRRRYPGPAGFVGFSATSSYSGVKRKSSYDENKQSDEDDSPRSVFDLSPWLTLCEVVGIQTSNSDFRSSEDVMRFRASFPVTISDIHDGSFDFRAPLLAAVIDSPSKESQTDFILKLHDPTGIIQAFLHEDVINDVGNEFICGSAVLLRDASIFVCGPGLLRSICIHPDTILSIFPAYVGEKYDAAEISQMKIAFQNAKSSIFASYETARKNSRRIQKNDAVIDVDSSNSDVENYKRIDSASNFTRVSSANDEFITTSNRFKNGRRPLSHVLSNERELNTVERTLIETDMNDETDDIPMAAEMLRKIQMQKKIEHLNEYSVAFAEAFSNSDDSSLSQGINVEPSAIEEVQSDSFELKLRSNDTVDHQGMTLFDSASVSLPFEQNTHIFQADICEETVCSPVDESKDEEAKVVRSFWRSCRNINDDILQFFDDFAIHSAHPIHMRQQEINDSGQDSREVKFSKLSEREWTQIERFFDGELSAQYSKGPL